MICEVESAVVVLVTWLVSPVLVLLLVLVFARTSASLVHWVVYSWQVLVLRERLVLFVEIELEALLLWGLGCSSS